MQAEKKSKEKKNNYTSLKDNFPASCTSSIQIDKCFYWLCPRVLSDEAMASLKKIFFKLKEIIYIFKNIDNLFGVWGLNIIIIINNLYLTSDLKKNIYTDGNGDLLIRYSSALFPWFMVVVMAWGIFKDCSLLRYFAW